MKLITIIALLLLSFIQTINFCKADNNIVAVVNDKPITTLELHKRVNSLVFLNNIDSTSVNMTELKQFALKNLIDQRVLESAAAKLKLICKPEMLSSSLQDLAQQRNMDLNSFLSLSQASNVDKEDLALFLKGQILWLLLSQEVINPKSIIVSQQEIMDQFLSMREQQKINADMDIYLAEIVIQNLENSAQKMDKLIKLLNAGSDFATLAKDFSVSPSKDSGGVVGWVRLSQIDPNIAHAIKGLSLHQISDPLLNRDHISIFKVLNKKSIPSTQFVGDEPTPTERQQIEQLLKRTKHNIKVKALFNQIKNAAFIEIKND